MSQPTTWGVPRDNSGGAVPPTTFAGRVDDSLDALLSQHKGSTAPYYAVAGASWLDDSASPWVLKRYDGANWIVEGVYDSASGKMQHRWYKGSDIASGATLTIPGDGNYFDVTGTDGPVTALSTLQAGAVIMLQFDAAVTLTHNATSLILPGLANIVTAAGDVAEFVSDGSGNWRMVGYDRAARQAFDGAWELIGTASPSGVLSADFIGLSSYRHLRMTFKITPVTDNVNAFIRTDDNNGASFDDGASDYGYVVMYSGGSSVTVASSTAGTAATFAVGVGNDTDEFISGVITISEWNQAARSSLNAQTIWRSQGGTFISGTAGMQRLSASAQNAIQIRFSSGNIASGFIMLEGVRG